MSTQAESFAIPASQRFASVAILTLILFVIASVAYPPVTLLAGAAAVIALIGSSITATPRTRVISILLTVLGIIGIALSNVFYGTVLEWADLGRVNQDIVAMIAGGAFVRGVLSTSDRTPKARLIGRPAIVRTAFVGHFFSAVLNLVSVGIVGDHLKNNNRLSLNNASLITQAYATAALWSPFWSVTALIVTYFPAASLLPTSGVGIVFAVMVVLIASLWNTKHRSPEELTSSGYPLQLQTLVVPIALILVVLTGSLLLPGTPVPRLVLIASLAVPLVLGVFRTGTIVTLKRFARVATSGLTASSNEAALFIAAGVFSVGGSMLTAHLPVNLSGVSPSVLSAWLLTVAIFLLALIGVHPIVTISLASAMALLVPDGAYLYGAAIAWGWAIAAVIGPLAGTVIYVSQRYAIKDRELIARNMPVAVLSVALALPGIFFVELVATALNLV